MHVRKTSDIWRGIDSNIDALFRDRLNHASNWYRYGLDKPEFDGLCWTTLITPRQQELIDELGPKFFGEADHIDVKIAKSAEADSAAFAYTLSAATKKCLPGHWLHWGSQQTVYHPDLARVATARSAAINAINTERTAFVANVKKFYEQAASINSLMKLWPAIESLLPKDVLEKLAEKKESTRSAVQIDAAALSALSTQLLKAKVAA